MSGTAYLLQRYGIVSETRDDVEARLPAAQRRCYVLLRRLQDLVRVHREFWGRRCFGKTTQRLIETDSVLMGVFYRFEVGKLEAALARGQAFIRQQTPSYVRGMLRHPTHRDGRADANEIHERVERDRETYVRLVAELGDALIAASLVEK
jgi:hypothetical protein